MVREVEAEAAAVVGLAALSEAADALAASCLVNGDERRLACNGCAVCSSTALRPWVLLPSCMSR